MGSRGDEVYENCLQEKIDNWCLSESGFPFARYNREGKRWRCYEKLNENGEKGKQCVNEKGQRVKCVGHSTESSYKQLHQTINAIIKSGCEDSANVNRNEEMTDKNEAPQGEAPDGPPCGDDCQLPSGLKCSGQGWERSAFERLKFVPFCFVQISEP